MFRRFLFINQNILKNKLSCVPNGASEDKEIKKLRKRKKREAETLRKERDMKSLKIFKAMLTLVAFVLAMGTFVFSDDSEKAKGTSTIIIQQATQQKEDISTSPGYLKWKEEYRKAEKKFKSAKKYVRIGQITLGAGILLSLLSPVLSAKESEFGEEETSSALAGTILGAGVAVVGGGLWVYGGSKRHSAKEKMDMLMNEGKIKGYLSASINPTRKHYAVTFTIAF